MLPFKIMFLRSAEEDLAYFRRNERIRIFEATMRILATEADTENKKRKRLRANPIAPWELRLGQYRVFYEVVPDRKVRVLAIGFKEHNDLFIRDEKVQL